MSTKKNTLFWFTIDLCLCAMASVAFYLGLKAWFAPALATGTAVFVCAVQSMLFKINGFGKNKRVLIGLQIVNGALLFLGSLAGIIFILPPSNISETGVRVLLLGAAFSLLTLLLLAHVWRQKINLASVFRYATWSVLPLLLFAIIRQLSDFSLIDYEGGVALFQFILGFLVALEIIIQSTKALLKKPKTANPDEVDLGLLLRFLFSRPTPSQSFFINLNQRFGVDFRSSWAIVVLRRAVEPILVGTILLGWISTAFVSVDTHQNAVVERLGTPLERVREPGLQVVFPWPVDRVHLVDTQRVLAMDIGHESSEEAEEDGEDESILWANQHADEEYTLLLGDGRDLISADGVLLFQITDPVAYLYTEQNPEDVLRAIAYRALMHETAHRTLDEALSENLILLAEAVTARIQNDAAEFVPSITPISFSFRALHPPVAVAEAYQSVVSAQIDRQTRIIRAKSYRRARIPTARAEKNTTKHEASADAVLRLAEAKGEAYAFEGLYSTVYSDIGLYRFRRTQESLEQQLKGKKMFIVDHRIEGEGATLWIQE